MRTYGETREGLPREDDKHSIATVALALASCQE